jgi:hypothetical protein
MQLDLDNVQIVDVKQSTVSIEDGFLVTKTPISDNPRHSENGKTIYLTDQQGPTRTNIRIAGKTLSYRPASFWLS